MVKLSLIFFLSFVLVYTQDPDSRELENLKNDALEKIIKNPDGTEFWLCFMRNHNDSPNPNDASTKLVLELFLTSDYDSKAKIEIKALNFSTEIEIPKGTVRKVSIPKLAQIKSSEVVESGIAVKITSDFPINAYGLNRRKLTTDTFLGLPIDVLGTEYLAIGYDKSIQLTSQFAIVATEDSTVVEIIPSVITAKGKKGNQSFKILLNAGDVYQVSSSPSIKSKQQSDLTGSYVKSNKKIAFFSGHQCAYVPSNLHACNHLVEQIPPINSWGTHYYIGKQRKRSSYTYRVLASEDSTKIFEDYKLLKTLMKGEYLESNSAQNIQLTSSHPVLVAQYSQGFRNGDSIGDPMMLLISPTQQFLTKYRFATPVEGQWEHYVNVVIPTKSIPSIKLDGKPIPKKKFVPFGTSRYSIAYLKVTFGTHELTADAPFGMSSYGFGYGKNSFDAYGNIGGQSFFDFIPTPDTLAPTAEHRELKDGNFILVRDDRENDVGLKKIQVLVADNFNFIDDKTEEGTPQINLKVNVADENKLGFMTFKATDLNKNTSFYTICYNLDPKTGTFRYYLNEGQDACDLNATYSVSLFSKNSNINHRANFSSSGDLITDGIFNDGSDFNFGFGGMVSYGILPKLNLSARLYFDKFSGVLSASDTVFSRERDGLDLIQVQEGNNIEMDSWNLNFGLSADYYFNSRFYALAGLRMNFMLGKSIIAEDEILVPINRNYGNSGSPIRTYIKEDGSELTELESLNSIGFGGFAGLGVSQRIYKDLSVFSELCLDYQFTDMISDGEWSVWQFYINLGVKYPL